MADHTIRVMYQLKRQHRWLRITCRTCRRIVLLPCDVAIATFGPLGMVSTIEKRLRCTHCGEKRAWMDGVCRERG